MTSEHSVPGSGVQRITLPPSLAARPPTPTSLAVGKTVGRYQMCFELASGGMATVYLARLKGSAGFEKAVALKCIHPHLARDAKFVEMFLDEARIASQVHHPNVCHIFDFGEADGSYFLAMEYLVGEPLSNFFSGLVREPNEFGAAYRGIVVRIMAEACEGLHAVHELRDHRGQPLDVVHRDVSPPNLFVSYDGNVKVVDFGIARAKHQLHHTTAGEVKGSVAYIAPEQIRAEEVDRRADVWSLGVILWEMLVGERLFLRDTDVKTMYAVLHDPVPAPSSLRPDIPTEYDAVVLRALSRDPERRYATARELGRELETLAARRGESAARADLAGWMTRLFPAGRERKQRLLSVAGELDPTGQHVHQRDSDAAQAVPYASLDEPTRTWRRGAWFGGACSLAVCGAALAWWSHGLPTRSVGEVDDVGHGVVQTIGDWIPGSWHESTDEVAEPVGSSAPPTDAPEDAQPRRTERRPLAPLMAAEGRVNIVTPDGWAAVYRGDERLGETPLQVTLAAGEHSLELRPNDRQPGRRVQVRVHGDETTRVVMQLDEPGEGPPPMFVP